MSRPHGDTPATPDGNRARVQALVDRHPDYAADIYADIAAYAAAYGRPRVTFCAFTRKWVVNERGDRHRCNARTSRVESAYRHHLDALDEAAFLAAQEYRSHIAAVENFYSQQAVRNR